jgi:DNA-binding MarR family transcriptional regulator
MTSEVALIRRFNRVVSQSTGVLDRHYLGRPRSVAASRLVFEIGTAGAEVSDLRERLGFDSGYLSRLLRTLERESLIKIDAAPSDRRKRLVRLTDDGLAELHVLNRLSDAAAEQVLSGLSEPMRRRFVEAAAVVTSALSSNTLRVKNVDVRAPQIQAALLRYYAELSHRFGAEFDPGPPGELDRYIPPQGFFLAATIAGEVVGCGGVRFDAGFAEIKRMWVNPSCRGMGIGRRLLRALERVALEAGLGVVRLDTSEHLQEARTLYAREGYREVPRYNENPYAHHWFEKRLPKDRLPEPG